MVSGPSSIVSFTYNGLGDRLSETTGGETIQFTLDLNTGLTQVLSDSTPAEITLGQARSYFYGLGRIAQVSTADSAYFLGDALGSVRQLANAQGGITLAKWYEPYGSVMSSVGADAAKYGYAGEWLDSTGLIHLRARYYNSAGGRFLSRDIWEGDANTPLSFNAYLYGYADPIYFTDPSGMKPLSCFHLSPEEQKTRPECPGYIQDVYNYNERNLPYGVTFYNSPIDYGAPELCVNQWVDEKKICVNKPPEDPEWQYVPAGGADWPTQNTCGHTKDKPCPHTGLCGQIAAAYIMNILLEGGISVNNVVDKFVTQRTDPAWPDYTSETDLAIFINQKYGDNVHAWVGKNNGPNNGLLASDWPPDYSEEGIMLSLRDQWFQLGTYVIAMISIDPSDPYHKGHLNFGVSDSSLHGRRQILTPRAEHWVVLTGVSDQWNRGADPETEVESYWNWVRVFNPFNRRTEYYWWGDFQSSWNGKMVRVEPANAPGTCERSGGYCNRKK